MKSGMTRKQLLKTAVLGSASLVAGTPRILSDPGDPFPVATGVMHVVVNGTPVLVDGTLTGQKPGTVIL